MSENTGELQPFPSPSLLSVIARVPTESSGLLVCLVAAISDALGYQLSLHVFIDTD